MRFDGRLEAKLSAFPIQRQRKFERFGRQHFIGGELHIHMVRAVFFQITEQLRKFRRVARRHSANKNQSVLLTTTVQLRAAGPAHTVESSLLYRTQLLLQRPFISLCWMPQERPKIGDVTENGPAHNGDRLIIAHEFPNLLRLAFILELDEHVNALPPDGVEQRQHFVRLNVDDLHGFPGGEDATV